MTKSKQQIIDDGHAADRLLRDTDLSRFLDERVQQGRLLRAAQTDDPDKARAIAEEEIRAKLEDLLF